MQCIQINLNKCKNATEQIFSYLVRNHPCVGLIQEPYSFRGKFPSHKGFKIYGVENSRAICIVPNMMPVFMNHHLSNKDHTVVEFMNGDETLILASIYCDINLEPISRELTNISNFLQRSNKKAIIGLDTNSWTPIWGSNSSNRRGMQFEEFVCEYHFDVMNRGKSPTFISSQGSSCIDVTLAYGCKDLVKSWEVLPGYFFTDHRAIKFFINSENLDQPTVQHIDWAKFKDALSVKKQSYPLWTAETVEFEAAELESIINQTLASCSSSSQMRVKDHIWWNEDLNSLRTKVMHLNVKMRNSNTAVAKERFLAAKKEFQRACRKEKRNSWKKYVSEISSPKSISLLNKILQKKKIEDIGILKDSEGNFAKSPQESINILMKSHHPDGELLHEANFSTSSTNSVPTSGVQSSSRPKAGRSTAYQNLFVTQKNFSEKKFCSKGDLNFSFITKEAVKLSIMSFGPHKIGGPDNYRPIVLQHFIQNENALTRLTTLYQAILELNYLPKHWTNAKVVFIPKPNKNDYSDPKSYRPISLMSFLLKALEKVVLWEIERSMANNPLSKDQHAFRKGYSCNTAISDLVDKVESNILQDKYALSIFLDIAGAFDTIKFSSIIKAMTEHNIPQKIVKWYSHFLNNRTAYTEIKGIKSSIKVKRGTPQGGILSPLAWNLVFEQFIKLFKTGPVSIGAYADDAALTIGGLDPGSMIDIMQTSINKATSWGAEQNLTFVPSKTNAIFFHRKKTLVPPKQLKINGIPIAFEKQIKYLGVYLDQKLTWKYHVGQKIMKAKKSLMMVRSAIGTLWGCTPLALTWFYKGIVMPSLTYGSLVWSRACLDGNVQRKLTSLNRLLALCLMPLRKSTPTAGLEVILNIPPPDLKVKETALNTMLRVLPHNRTRWLGYGKKGKGHIAYAKNELLDLGIKEWDFDTVNKMSVSKDFTVDLQSFMSGQLNSNTELTCFTDGSKLKGMAGYGLGITQNDTVIDSENGCIGTEHSVFQAEVLAIHKACERLFTLNAKSVTIYSDSQSALSALAGWKITSKTVSKCIDNLNLLGQQSTVDLKWCKGHSNITGNELADFLAKSGTTNLGNQIAIPKPLSWAKQLIRQSTNREWCHKWYFTNIARQTKIWFPSINQKASKILCTLPRKELGLLTQMITGHNRLSRHESLVNPAVSPTCRKCMEEEETAWHIIAECPMLLNKRWQTFKIPFLDNPPVWRPWTLLRFLQIAKIEEMNQREDLLPP